jgi:glycine/D-amino acid oxidase-like deaminating enzyme
LFRIRADMRQWLWGLQFMRECTPARTRHNIEQIVRLGTYSRDTLQKLRRSTGLQYDQRTQGILHFYTSQKKFDASLAPAEQMRALGCERQVIGADEAVKLEPALRHIRPQLAGATYTAEDESGDATQASFWIGLRPATPSNVPIIGRSKLPNFYLNTGHGTLGWTHACGSGKSIAHIVSGLAPEVDFAFCGATAAARAHPVPAVSAAR